ncbi:MAG: pyridoxal-dependent decarboxylase, partial [Phormidesmis sp.]
FKDFGVLKRSFRIPAPYMSDDSQWPNLGELTIQGTRHPDILKLWLSLQHLGAAGYADIIRHSYRLTAQFVEAVQTRPELQLASQPEMNLVCFRLAPDQIDPSHWDALNAQLQRYLLSPPDSTAAFLSLPTYRRQRWLKAVLLNPYTRFETIEQLFTRIDQFIGDNTG